MFETLDFGSNNNKIKGPLGCLVSVKKGLKYTLLNSYVIYACNIYREFIKVGVHPILSEILRVLRKG